MKPELSIIIPCYNEEKNIKILIKDLIKNYISNSEIIFVDNGSTDSTFKILNDEIKKLNIPLIRFIRVKKNQGYGNGIIEGIKESQGNIIGWTHSDLQTDIKDVYDSFNKINKNKDEYIFLKGIRQNRPIIDNLFTYTMGVFSSIILGVKINDINAQPKLFNRKFYYLMKDSPKDFSLDLYVVYLAKKNDIKIHEHPVYFNERKYGYAKGGGGSFKMKLKLIIRTLKYIYKLKSKL